VNRTTVQEGYEQVQQALLDYCVTCYPQVQVCAEPFRLLCCFSSMLYPLTNLNFEHICLLPNRLNVVSLVNVKICMVGFGFPFLVTALLLLVTKCMYHRDSFEFMIHFMCNLTKWLRKYRKMTFIGVEHIAVW
jgi:hypothetical protein